jgi:hypothetical protein
VRVLGIGAPLLQRPCVCAGVPAVKTRSKVHAAISVRIAASDRAIVARKHGGSTASLRLRAAHVSFAAQE